MRYEATRPPVVGRDGLHARSGPCGRRAIGDARPETERVARDVNLGAFEAGSVSRSAKVSGWTRTIVSPACASRNTGPVI